jgi:hypothetical protein
MKLTILKILVLLLVLTCKSSFAQDNVNTTTTISATLMRGLSMEGGNSLFLSELALKNTDAQKNISNFDGLKFTILGQSNRLVTILYDEFVTLTNVNQNSSSGTQDAKLLTFKTNIAEETGPDNGYNDPSPLPSGTSISLYDNSAVGKVNLWIGGTMYLPVSLKNGKYIGKFVVTSVY